MTVEFFWDRDADLILCAVPVQRNKGGLWMFFGAQDDPCDLWTAVELAPDEGGSHCLGAVPRAKLPSAGFRYEVAAAEARGEILAEGTIELLPGSGARVGRKVWTVAGGGGQGGLGIAEIDREDPPAAGSPPGLNEAGSPVRRTRDRLTAEPVFVVPRAGVEAIRTAAPAPPAPSAPGPMKYRAGFHNGKLWPTAHAEGAGPAIVVRARPDKTAPRIALSVEATAAPTGPLRLQVQRLGLEVLADTATPTPLLDLLQDIASLDLVSGAAPGTDFDVDTTSVWPLDRIVLRRATGAADVGAKDPAAPARPDDAVEFVMVADNGTQEDHGPVMAFASYGNTLCPDPALSRVLRAELAAKAEGRHSTALLPPGRHVLDVACRAFDLTVAPDDFVRHADRVRTASTVPLDEDDRLLDGLRSAAEAHLDAAQQRQFSAWFAAARNAKVPFDRLRMILLDRPMLNMALFYGIRPTPGAPDRFYRDLRELVDLVETKYRLHAFAARLEARDIPQRDATSEVWLDWFRNLGWETLPGKVDLPAMVARVDTALFAALRPPVLALASHLGPILHPCDPEQGSGRGLTADDVVGLRLAEIAGLRHGAAAPTDAVWAGANVFVGLIKETLNDLRHEAARTREDALFVIEEVIGDSMKLKKDPETSRYLSPQFDTAVVTFLRFLIDANLIAGADRTTAEGLIS